MFNLKSFPANLFIITLVILIIVSIFRIIYDFSTPFTKTITLKEKYLRNAGRSRDVYMIVDTDNNIYQLSDVWYRGEFNMANDYVGLEIGKKYKLTGYGNRVHFLSWYPYVYTYSHVN